MEFDTASPATQLPQPLEDAAPRRSLELETSNDAKYLGSLGYKQELDRVLGFFSSFAIQFSSISVGSSLYTTMIVGLAYYGPASFFSYLTGGAAQVLLVGTAVAALVSAYPLSGGVYQIINRLTKQTWLGFQAGWWLIIGHLGAVTAVAVSLVPFVADWVGQDSAKFSTLETSLWSAAIIVLVTIFNLAGVRVVAAINNLGVVAELIGITMVIGGLVLFGHFTQGFHFLTETGGAVTHGHSALKAFAFAMLVPTFIISSFDATGNAAEETKNAARNAPIGSMIANISAWIAGAFFMLLVLLSVPSLKTFMTSSVPVKYVLASAVGSDFAKVFEVLAVLALFAAMVILQLTGARILWAQARDGQLPAAKALKKVSAVHKIPVNATIVAFVIPVALAFWSSALTEVVSLTALTWAAAYGVAVIAGLYAIARRRLPLAPFRLGVLAVPVFILAAVWSVVICTIIVWSDPGHVGVAMIWAIVIGFVIYFAIPSSRRGRVPGVHDEVAPL